MLNTQRTLVKELEEAVKASHQATDAENCGETFYWSNDFWRQFELVI
jgi:hypothetical protein